jgi:hypothetical protein
MSTEQQIRDALRSVADDGPDPDVDAAWAQLQHRLRDTAAPRRGRWVLVAGAALAAAAALVFVTTRPDTEQSVDVGVADGSDASQPDDRTHQSAVGVPITLPADPVAVLAPEGGAVHVMDPATGQRVGTIQDSGGGRAIDAVATPAGDVFVLLQGDEPMLARARWDGGDLEHFVGWPGASAAGLAIHPGGRLAAVGQLGTDGRSAIALVDVQSAAVRELRWPAGDPRGELHQPQELSFSPDGSQLAFVNVHDSDGTEGFDAYVVDVDATDLGAARQISNAGWEDTWNRIGDVTFAPSSIGGIVAVTRLDDSKPQVRFVEGGPDVGLPTLNGVLSVQASAEHLLARTEDAWYALHPADDAWRLIGFEDWTG